MFITIGCLEINTGRGNMFHTQLVEEEEEEVLCDQLRRGKSGRAVRKFRNEIFVPASIGLEEKKFCIGSSNLKPLNSRFLLPLNLLL